MWLLPLACGVAGLMLLTVLGTRLRHVIEPTLVLIDRFGREHVVALGRLQEQTAITQQRLADD